MRRFVGLVAATALTVGGLSVQQSNAASPSALFDRACARTLTVSATGPVTNPAITEASGIVASRRQPGIYWVHNDSGDSARIFAINTSGARLATFVLSGIGAFDWEDIALGPGPIAGVDYLYVGDIGDNFRIRSTIRVLRFREPTIPTTPAQLTISTGVSSAYLQYPGGARNAESLMVDPRTAMLYVVTKRVSTEPIRIFRARANLAHGSTTTMTDVGSPNLVNGGNPTGIDITRDAHTIALRTYRHVYLYDVPTNGAIATAMRTTPCVANAPTEPQGEAIAFHADDQGFVTLSEGSSQPLNHRDV